VLDIRVCQRRVGTSGGRGRVPRPVPSYRLISTDGEDLGSFRAAVPDWCGGDRIHRGRAGDLLVVRLVAAEPGDEVDGYLVVEPAPS
jgi:hypothetical protein